MMTSDDSSILLEATNSVASGASWFYWVLVAALGALFAYKFLLQDSKKKANLPPSPGAMPIVGSFPFMGVKAGEPAHKMFARLGDKFGPITYIRMGSCPTIIISNSDMAKLMLKDHDHVFNSRPYLSAGKYMGMDFTALAFASGNYHKRLRKIYNSELLGPKRVNEAHLRRQQGVFVALGTIYQLQKDGEVVNLSSLLNNVSLNSLMGLIFGWKAGTMAKSIGTVKMVDLKAVVRESVELAGEFNFGDFITVARWLDLQGIIGRMKKVSNVMMAMSTALIEEHARTGQKSRNAPDATILDMVLSQEGDEKLSPMELAGVVWDLIIAGSDTTGVASDWTIAELLRQPELVRRLQAELDSVTGKERFVTVADIPRLPFLQAVVKESLRLHPPAPLGVPHCSLTDCKLAGFDIAAGTTALVNIWAIHRDPKVWPEPARFDPDRFMQEDVSLAGTAYHFMPFSSGRRICPGMLLALTMIQLLVGNLIHGFEFHVAGGLTIDEIDVVNETPGIVSTRAQDLCVTAIPRLNPKLYEEASQQA